MSFNWQPHDYQKKAIQFMVSRACAGLFLDPGLGKTAITYAAFNLLRKLKMVRTMLVIAPLRPAQSTWPAEARKWIGFNGLKVVVLHGPNKDALLKAGADVFIINPEGLAWFTSACKIFPDVLVVDESTRFKHHNTLRFKLLRAVLPRFKRRYILTGSPAPNGLLDLFGQVFVLDLGESLGRYITHYRMKYFNQVGFGGFTWVPKLGADKEIYKKLAPYVLHMSAEDYLDLPPLLGVLPGTKENPANIVEVELPAKAMKIYREMERLLIAKLESGEVTAANASVAAGKCRQIANGGVYGATTEDRTNIHTAKIEAVQELVEELQGTPALVAYEFQHDLDRLRTAFPDAPVLGGGVTNREFRAVEARWNAGEIPVLLAQPQSVAHGLNLQGTKAHVIWHSLTHNLEFYEQFIDRVHRQGQEHRVLVHHIVAKGTVDEAIIKAVSKKDRTQQALLTALREHYR